MKTTIVFDGGSTRNGRADSLAYGSFSINGGNPIRFEFPNLRTNNEAEMQIAIEALYWLMDHNPHHGMLDVTLRGDSQLAINCFSGTWKVRKKHLKPFVAQFNAVRGMFNSVNLVWHRRHNSVAALGH